MRRYYQTEWQGIRFSEFAPVSSRVLAGPDFYQAFYEAFFARYKAWRQLSSGWLTQKERLAAFLLSRCHPGARVLSVGCGLGAVEHFINAARPAPELSIQEVAPSAWRWIGPEFPDSRKFLGLLPACLPADRRFDLVYLSAVDYALDDAALVSLLAAIRGCLASGGAECLLISASFKRTPVGLRERVSSWVQDLKVVAAAVLDRLHVRPRGQLWGWLRTRDEYRTLMARAGYATCEDGFVDGEQGSQYWIAGRGALSDGPQVESVPGTFL